MVVNPHLRGLLEIDSVLMLPSKSILVEYRVSHNSKATAAKHTLEAPTIPEARHSVGLADGSVTEMAYASMLLGYSPTPTGTGAARGAPILTTMGGLGGLDRR
jgi:hypothetical protein